MMDTFTRFKEETRIQKCDGEITKEKLLAFICNYNNKDAIFKVLVEGVVVTIKAGPVNMAVLDGSKYSDFNDCLIMAMMTLMELTPRVQF